MTQAVNNWGPAAVIVIGYIIAAWWQSKRFDDQKLWLNSEFRAVEERFRAADSITGERFRSMSALIDERFKTVNEKLDRLDGRVKTLEDARSSGVIGAR